MPLTLQHQQKRSQAAAVAAVFEQLSCTTFEQAHACSSECTTDPKQCLSIACPWSMRTPIAWYRVQDGMAGDSLQGEWLFLCAMHHTECMVIPVRSHRLRMTRAVLVFSDESGSLRSMLGFTMDTTHI
jgi:hypothetical protein